MKYIIGLDLDGTLLTDEKSILEVDKNIIIHWLDSQQHVVIVTGRRYYSALEILQSHSLYLPIISNNGCLIRDKEERTLYRDIFYKDELLKIINTYPSFDVHPVFHVDGYHQGFDMVYFDMDKNKNTIDYCSDGLDRTIVAHSLNQVLNLDHLAIVFVGDVKNLFSYQSYLNEKYPSIFNIHILENLKSNSSIMEVLTNRTNKWIGLQKYADFYKIDHDNIITVGDDTNDIAMVTQAKYGIAMKNGGNSLMELATRISKRDNNHGGAVHSVKELLERLNKYEN
ncbi:MAG: HAD-IIB family hydrolase [Tissierellia bacterium]|nr:HAD-IIB family hydrolase [Tissierellia bacterium]